MKNSHTLTKTQRNKEVANLILQLCFINMDWILGSKEMEHIFNYINNGVDYVTSIDMPKYAAELDISLKNIKGVNNCMNLKRKKFNSNDEFADKMNFENFQSLQRVIEGKDKPEIESKNLDDMIEDLDDDDLDELMKNMKDEDIEKMIQDLE